MLNNVSDVRINSKNIPYQDSRVRVVKKAVKSWQDEFEEITE